MKAYSHDTRCNFLAHESFNVNNLELARYAHIVYPFKSLCNIFGIEASDCTAACHELEIENNEILDIEYFSHEQSSDWNMLLKKRCAYRNEKDGYSYRTVYYSAFVVNSQCHCYTQKLAEYFCRKFYPGIFGHPGFQYQETNALNTSDLTISEVLQEFGDMKISDIRQLPLKSSKTYQRTNSKFSIYQIHDEKNYEIYLSTANGQSLYIPFRAIQERNYTLVEKRHVSYHKDYYKNNPKYLELALGALETPEARLLSSLLSN